MVQSRSGSDNMELKFAGIQQNNSKPTTLQASKVIRRCIGSRSSCFTMQCKANTSRDNTIHTANLMAPIYRKDTKKKKVYSLDVIK